MTARTVNFRGVGVKLIHGDALHILSSMSLRTVDTILADPPYGICYRSTKGERIMNDERPFVWWLNDAFRLLKPCGSMLCFCRWDVEDDFRRAIEMAGFRIRSQVIWDREHHGMGDTSSAFAPRHENIWFATKGNFSFPGRRPSSLLSCSNRGGKRFHPMQKPVELIRQLLGAVTPAEGKILDPFMGSGTAALAALQLGLGYTGIEFDEKHFRTAVERFREARKGRSGPQF